MAEKKRVNIYIDEQLWRRAKHLCVDRNISFSELLVELLEKHLGKA